MRIRALVFGALGAALLVTMATAAELARGPTAYNSLTTVDAAACARACAEDGICMAWSFGRENRCELSAVVPAEANTIALATGLAARAPANLQRLAPVVHTRSASPPDPPPPAPSEVPAPRTADASGLLGGPGDGDLRLGLR